MASSCTRSARQERIRTVCGGWGWPQRQRVALGRWQPRQGLEAQDLLLRGLRQP